MVNQDGVPGGPHIGTNAEGPDEIHRPAAACQHSFQAPGSAGKSRELSGSWGLKLLLPEERRHWIASCRQAVRV